MGLAGLCRVVPGPGMRVCSGRSRRGRGSCRCSCRLSMRRSRCTLTRVACDDPSMIKSEELQVDGRPALLTVPAEGPVRAGVVALHGSSSSSYRQVIFEHLANTLAPLGIAVLSFERAPWPTDDVDIPYAVQAAGAVAAYDELRSRHAVPIGFWGVSQGTWIAALAASERT